MPREAIFCFFASADDAFIPFAVNLFFPTPNVLSSMHRSTSLLEKISVGQPPIEGQYFRIILFYTRGMFLKKMVILYCQVFFITTGLTYVSDTPH